MSGPPHRNQSLDDVKHLQLRIEELESELQRLRSRSGQTTSTDRTLFETTGTATVILAADTTIVQANDTFCHLAELPRQEIEGKLSWTVFVSPEDLRQMREYHEKRRIAGENPPRNYEFHFISSKGSVYYMYLTINLIPDTQLSIASLADVTPLKVAQEALQVSQDRMKTILEHMPVMLGARDENDMICAWNKECERVTGWKAEDVIGNPDVDDLFYPDPAYRMQMKKELNIRKGDYRNWEWKTACKDGTTRIIAWSNISRGFPVPGWDSWGVGIDVTSLREAEIQAREHEKLLVARQLAATVAHEFRQPLAALILAADLISMHRDDPAHIEKLTKTVHSAVNRSEALVNKLLSLTQIESRNYAKNIDILDLDKSAAPPRNLD